MNEYNLDGNSYNIKNYDQLFAFSSFLPGLAGIKGIPIWVFYTNRGQCINSFGINDKDQAIMEFNPANTAYENTSLKGFRTFIKKDGDYYEPFQNIDPKIKKELSIEFNNIKVSELNEELGLEITINYYVLPKENIGSLVRNVTIKNVSNKETKLEILDGMPKIIPYGVKNKEYKEVSNLLKSWSLVENTENNAPYYTLIAASDDSAEVKEIQGGYFYTSILDGEVLPVVYDIDIIFDYDNSLVNPVVFKNEGLSGVKSKEQYYTNKIPCGFSMIEKSLNANESIEFNTLIGFSLSKELLNQSVEKFRTEGYFDKKREEARELINEFIGDVFTKTNNNTFDKYISQCYLDNFLRGGYPYTFNKDKNKSVIHLFSRKHGDPERDYNFFSIAGEYYSQGNGNFRDVCQNRRNDVFFNKDIEDFNIKNFFSLVQSDGFNPLEIRPSTFTIKEDRKEEVYKLIDNTINENSKSIKDIIETNFTPGQVSNKIAKDNLVLNIDEDEFIEKLMNETETHLEAGFGEGYWSDHFNYLMDLVDNYLMMYPDKEKELLFDNNTYRYYSSIEKVNPRNKTFVYSNGKVRKYGSLSVDKNKQNDKDFNLKGTNWLKYDSGETIETNLINKMLVLAANKFSLLDPYGMGIQMDGGRPGWNDAMNGLPGLFGSGMPETLELTRLVKFIKETLTKYKDEVVEIPAQICDFAKELQNLADLSLKGEVTDFEYWDKVSNVREAYIEETSSNLKKELVKVNVGKILEVISTYIEKLEDGIKRAMDLGKGIMPTYLTFEAKDYEVLEEKSHYENLPTVKIKSFEINPLPYFLEGPCKALKTLDKETAKKMHEEIKKTDIYDKKLKMFKTSGSLENISHENGRIRAFTPGWLERESVFLHMEYKYFLNLLRSGLYDEYFEGIHDALIPYLDPKVYGRSVLENSSFLASSANPNPHTHGKGYVARLSGSTTEMISMWIDMFVGIDGGFKFDKELEFKLNPILNKELFDENKEARFRLFSNTDVIYVNESMKNTYGEDSIKVSKIIYEVDGKQKEVETIKGEDAIKLRNGLIKSMKVVLS